MKKFNRNKRLKLLAKKGYYPTKCGSDIAINNKGRFKFVDTRNSIECVIKKKSRRR